MNSWIYFWICNLLYRLDLKPQRLQLYVDGRSQWPDAAMDMKDFAVHGGAFPVRVKGCGVVASIAVSGLPSREDHDMIICVLRDHLGLNDVPPTP